MKTRPTHSRRAAFTLVEILVVITVIGILIGLLAAGVVPALRRTNEFTIQSEILQMERAIEQFHTKYGFYPPSFVRVLNNDFDGDGNVNEPYEDQLAFLLQYVNRISPNHVESISDPATQMWWDNIGSNLDFAEGEDLTFWLAGLSKNKQFPLSDTAAEREVFYEFKTSQTLDTDGDGILSYIQPKGAEVPYLYIDNESSGSGPSIPDITGATDPVYFDAYSTPLTAGGMNNGGRFDSGTFIPGTYENPNTFQIVSFGLDGDPGAPFVNATEDTYSSNWNDHLAGRDIDTQALVGTGSAANDNITNFANGRLEKMALGTNTN